MKKQPPSFTKAAYATIIFLLLFALIFTSLRSNMRSEDTLPPGDSAWSITIKHHIETQDNNVIIAIAPPWETQHSRVYSQTLTHHGLRIRRLESKKKNRDIVLTAAKPGKYTIESSFKIYVSTLPLSDPKKAVITETNRAKWLSSDDDIIINSKATSKVIEKLISDNQDINTTIKNLFNYVSNTIRIDSTATSNSEKALTNKRANNLGITRALTALLRSAHLPARVVTGLDLQSFTPEPHYWTEVYDGERWLPLDPVKGYFVETPIFYIPMRKGGDQLINSENATVTSSYWSIELLPSYEGMLSSKTREFTDIFDLTRLSPTTREILSALLLLPLGVLITELIRQFAGIRTFGTFTPTLLALAFTHVYWMTATIVLFLVTVIGLTVRSAIPKLNLARTPRLAIVFILVAICMTFVLSGINFFDPDVDNAISLLPIVILTMLIDRIYTVYDEQGIHPTVIRLFWTIISAFASAVVLLQSHWGTWLLAYPELHAITLAVIIMVGLYSGPVLCDLPACKWLREPPRKLRNRKADKRQCGQAGESI